MKQSRGRSSVNGVAPTPTVRRRSVMALAVVVAVAMVYGGIQLRRHAAPASLPRLPDLSIQPKAVGDHLRERDAAARDDPRSVTVVGPLCLAYHADMVYDMAEQCYARGRSLDPPGWQWPYYRALAESARGSGGALAAGMRKVVALAPDFGPAWWRLGEAEFKEGRYDAAAEAWRRARSLPEPDRTPPAGTPVHLASAPLSSYAALGLARLALVRGDPDGSRRSWSRSRPARPLSGRRSACSGRATRDWAVRRTRRAWCHTPIARRRMRPMPTR